MSLVRNDGLVYAVGIEDTAIGVALRGSGRRLDEYELTGHLDQWREDLARAAATGASAIRYGLPWYRVNPASGRYDWAWADEVIGHLASVTGLRVILDLVHYGTPGWLPQAFADPAYPAAVAEYAGAVSARYRGAVAAYTPLNEPLVTASFCGMRGVWPPYLSGSSGWATVVTAIAAGVQASVRAIRAADPGAEIVHVEAVQAYRTADLSLRDETRLWEQRAELPTRLILGRVAADDEMWSWLRRHGVAEAVLTGLASGGVNPDVIGLNYYPELSCRELVRLDGGVAHVAYNGGSEQLAEVLRRWHASYGLPLMITETGVEGDSPKKHAWLDELVACLGGLRRDGVPIVGLTWWPLIDFVDWAWASDGAVVEEFYMRDRPDGLPRPVPPPGRPGGPPGEFLRRMGMYRVVADGDGRLEREPTTLVEHFRSLALGTGARGADARGTGARGTDEREVAGLWRNLPQRLGSSVRARSCSRTVPSRCPVRASCCSGWPPTRSAAPTAPSTSTVPR
jgi:beta-glucosidase/6-phospho-beta-glucosidase/beta-galactosidase